MADTVPDPTRILEEEIQRARDAGDHGRLLALAGALLGTAERAGGRAQGGPDARALRDLIAESARALVEGSVPGDLEAALGWAMTWMKLCRSDAARAWIGTLQERIAGVRAREEVLRLALAGNSRRTLMDAIKAFVVSPDRCPGSEELLAEAKRTLSERLEQAHRLRLEIDGLLPGAVDQAAALVPRLIALDAAPEYDELKQRLDGRVAAVAARHAQIEEALRTGAIPPLARAVDALVAGGDQLAGTPALLERARAALAALHAERDRQRAACAAAGTQRVDHALAALEALVRLDPEAPEAAQLPALRARHGALAELHQRIESSLSRRSGRQLAAAVRELHESPQRLSSSQELLDQAQITTRRFRRRDERHRRLRKVALWVAGVAAAAVLALWLRDRSARAAIESAPDDGRRLALAQAYAGAGHLFYTDEVAARASELARSVDDAAFKHASEAGDPVERIARLEAYARRPGARAVDAELAAARREVVERGFEAALKIPDVDRRIAALEAFAASAPPDAAEKARKALESVLVARDQAAWQKVLDTAKAEQRLAALDAYQALPAPRRHDGEVARLRAEAQRELARVRDQAVDDQAWETARATVGDAARIAACQAYLAGPTAKAHGQAAHAEIAAAQERIDDAAWQQAQGTTGDAEQRIAAYEAYLAARTVQRHAATARTTIDHLRGELDDAAWKAATEPGTPAERVQRLRAYLAGATRARRAEAEAEIERITSGMDQAAFNQAVALADPEARLAALDAYLLGANPRFKGAAGEQIGRTLGQLAELPVDRLAALPLPLLVRIPPTALQRLPAAQLARLPPTVQSTVPLEPAWRSNSGVDRRGRWAELLIGGAPVRFRHVLPGTVALPGGGALDCAHGFWLAEQECSQGLWSHIMGSTGRFAHQGGDLPVDSLSRDQCLDFVDAINSRLRKVQIDAEVRLPTGVEWRWAAATANGGAAAIERGTALAHEPPALRALAWCVEAGAAGPRGVDRGESDGWGCLNLFGNVAEWCADDHERSPHWRGGSWRLSAADCTAERVVTGKASTRSPDVGLRLVIGK